MVETDKSADFLTCFGVCGNLNKGQILVKKYPILTPVASRLCKGIFNGYLWSYIIEKDISGCVLTYFEVDGDLKG